MTIYEELLEEANSSGLIVREKTLSGSNGLIYKNRIAISNRLKTSAEKACVLAEEIDITILLSVISLIYKILKI